MSEKIFVVLIQLKKKPLTYDNSIAIVVASANKVTEVIKSLQKGKIVSISKNPQCIGAYKQVDT